MVGYFIIGAIEVFGQKYWCTKKSDVEVKATATINVEQFRLTEHCHYLFRCKNDDGHNTFLDKTSVFDFSKILQTN